MRKEEQTPLEVIGVALDEAHALGKSGDHPHPRRWFDRQAAAFAMVHELDAAGFSIVPRPGQEAISAGGAALEREIERSFGEPLDAVPDAVADLRAEAISRVIHANLLLAQAGEVLGAKAVELLLENLAAPALEAA